MNVMKTTDKPTLSIILRGNIVALEDGLIFGCKVLKLQSAVASGVPRCVNTDTHQETGLRRWKSMRLLRGAIGRSVNMGKPLICHRRLSAVFWDEKGSAQSQKCLHQTKSGDGPSSYLPHRYCGP